VTRLVRIITASALACGIATTAQAQQVRVIASNPQGSIFYAASVVIGKLMDEKLKMQVRVQPTAGTSTFIPQLDRAEIDFGLTNVDDSQTSYKGIEAFKRPNPNLRLTAIAFPLTLGVMVPNDSPIKSIADLKGKILPWGYNAQTTGRVLQRAVLASAGLTMDDVKTVPTQSLFSGVDLLGEGKVEAATISVGTGQGQQANVKLASRGGVRFINMDSSPEAVARIRKVLPARPFVVQPAAYAVGIHGPTTIMAYNIFFTTNDKMPDDVVYNLVKMLHESKDDLVKGQPVFRGFDPKVMTEEIGVPWHPGAIKFYKEVGQWPPKN
jgi:TRAP transporter TAXI family solute receptor